MSKFTDNSIVAKLELLNWRFAVSGFIILFFFGSFCWANWQDPFSRIWFTLLGRNSMKCMAILPKPIRPYPIVIYVHNSDGNLIKDGGDLRQIASLGLAAVSIEYNETNVDKFALQFDALLHYLREQKWAKSNAIAWIGFGVGAKMVLNYANAESREQPQLLVQLNGPSIGSEQFKGLHCSLLLINCASEKTGDLGDALSGLKSYGFPVDLKRIPNVSEDLQPDRGVVFRCIGEYCFRHFADTKSLQEYRSALQWQSGVPTFWLFCIPAIAWACGWCVWFRPRKQGAISPYNRREKVLYCYALALSIFAFSETTIHVIMPDFNVSQTTISIARKFLERPSERMDFEVLAAQPYWRGQKMKVLLNHVELANYTRELVNWQLSEEVYQDFVLSPTIKNNSDGKMDWRQVLWEEFYPRIRRENSPADAAEIVVRHLREQVTIADISDPSRDVSTIWRRQITDKIGFEIIYVAVLRSVGVPARLNTNGQAEFFDGEHWKVAPEPPIISW